MYMANLFEDMICPTTWFDLTVLLVIVHRRRRPWKSRRWSGGSCLPT